MRGERLREVLRDRADVAWRGSAQQVTTLRGEHDERAALIGWALVPLNEAVALEPVQGAGDAAPREEREIGEVHRADAGLRAARDLDEQEVLAER